MDVYEKIDEMSERLQQNESKKISGRIDIYSNGVKAKIKNAEYALLKIKNLSPRKNELKDPGEEDFCVFDKINFYLDSFFAFLYSTFDIISQVVNQKCNIGEDERRVSFKCIKDRLNDNCPGTEIQKLFDKLSGKHFLKNLDKYRNCSTHRRQIYMKTDTHETSETPGYELTESMLTVKRTICDDPLILYPKIRQERELVPYCTKMLEKVKSEIIDISKKI